MRLNFITPPLFGLLCLTLFLNGCSAPSSPASTPLYTKGKLLFEENFDSDSIANWIVEAKEPNATTVRATNGRLETITPAGLTVWFNQKISGDYLIEYDATVVSDDRVSDLNCFWSASDPKNTDFFANSTARGGIFANYNFLNLYYVGCGGNTNTTTRFRKYSGTETQGAIITEYTDKDHLLTADHPYHIQLVVFKGRIRYIRDGEILVSGCQSLYLRLLWLASPGQSSLAG